MGNCSSSENGSQPPSSEAQPLAALPIIPLSSPTVGEVRAIGRGVSRRGSTFVHAAEVTGKTLPTGVTTGMHTVSPLREGFDPMQLAELEVFDEPVSPRLQRQLSQRSTRDDNPPSPLPASPLFKVSASEDGRLDFSQPVLSPRKPSERSSNKRKPARIDFDDDTSTGGLGHSGTPLAAAEPSVEKEIQPLKIMFDLASPRLTDETIELHTVAYRMDEKETHADAIENEQQCLQLLTNNTSKETSHLLLVRAILLSSKWEANESVMVAGYNELLRLSVYQELIDWMAEWGLVLGLIEFVINPVFSHLKSSIVQAKFCAVLAMLCEKLGDEGVLQLNKSVHALIMALRYHPQDLGVQKFGISALANVVRGDSNAESQTNQFLVVAMGGIELVCAALAFFTTEGPKNYIQPDQEVPPNVPVPALKESKALQTAGVGALCVFSNNPSFHKQIIEAQGVRAVLEGVRLYRDHLALKMRALVFMHNMCEKGDSEAVRKIWQDVGLRLPALLSEAAEEKDMEIEIREELAVLRNSLANTLSSGSNRGRS